MPDQMTLQERRDGATVVLTIDNPARRNALSMPIRVAMVEALERIEGDRSVRAIVLTGAGTVFSSGGDISGMDAADLAAGRERFRLTHRLVRLMIKSAKPIIAAVEGWCAGGAVGLALAGDTVVASADARFVMSFGKIGLVPDFGCLHTLPLRIGQGRARQMMLYGEPIGAAEALQIGLIDQMVPPGTALAAAIERSRLFDATAPLPVALTKQYLANGLDAALDWERDAQSTLFLTSDHAEGKSAFLEKRPPTFEGR
ncbi:MAG TPA: enoyl-CoA hydratase-related protein [Aliidongia sp.]|uniref:enoyl-CoA hydratase/isomerase family protein n=1 Tax=Aliidongia sp. TaxID=1914230 RepID=UPI002DDCA9E4|nr:enoyl-CoA hydratase-related protein [Aliidongia sp.]HEV2675122.1 enoyl-CoA hydratase-related protein [Aliidongia sp.]